MQVAVNRVSALCVCVCVCVCSSGTIESPSLRMLGEGQEEAAAKYGQMTELPESSSSASRLWQVRSACECRLGKTNPWESTQTGSDIPLNLKEGCFTGGKILIQK